MQLTDKDIQLDGHVFTVDGWTFEIKSIIGRKVENYGEEYTGVTTINIADGVPHLEALHCDDFTMTDYKTLHKFVTKKLDFSTFQYSRYSSDLVRKDVKK
jgi:hypothetical protein